MKIAVLGTGMVGQTIGSALIRHGHEVRMGSRTSANPKALEWVTSVGAYASTGNFAEAAAFGEIIFNCSKGIVSLEVLKAAGENNLRGKIIIDIANPLDFSTGTLRLSVCNDDSLAEQLQREFPSSHVVKTLNTVNCNVMVNPSLINGEHDLFICGNNEEAKKEVVKLLKTFGWDSVIDLGDITGARAMEQMLPMWIRLFGKFKTTDINFKVVKPKVKVAV